MKATWQQLVTENPMLAEIGRFRRRFLNPTGSSAMSGVLIALLLVGYLGLLFVVFSARGVMDPIAVVMFQTFVFVLLAPAMLYAAIAGEREKRTWDLLLVAPITPAQIVMGKFVAALCGFGIGLLAFLVPILMCGLTYDRTSWSGLIKAELVSATFIMLLAAVTLFFSARSRRSLMALGIVLGVLGIVLIVVPVLGGVLLDRWTNDLLNSFHPFIVLGNIMSAVERQNDPMEIGLPVLTWGYPQVLAYSILTIIFVAWSIRTLTFAENDIKFVPTHPHA